MEMDGFWLRGALTALSSPLGGCASESQGSSRNGERTLSGPLGKTKPIKDAPTATMSACHVHFEDQARKWHVK